MFFWGAAFSFKLQAVFILPMIMLMYIKNKDFPLKKFVGSIVSIVCLALPGILNGRNILDILKIYFGACQEHIAKKCFYFLYKGGIIY